MKAGIAESWRKFSVGDLMLLPRSEGFVCAVVVESPKGENVVVVAWGDVVMPVVLGHGPAFPIYAGRPEQYGDAGGELVGQIRPAWQQWHKELQERLTSVAPAPE